MTAFKGHLHDPLSTSFNRPIRQFVPESATEFNFAFLCVLVDVELNRTKTFTPIVEHRILRVVYMFVFAAYLAISS
jgi:hypothetical protein